MAWTDQNEVQAFIVSAEANVRYLTGFTGEAIAVISAQESVLVTDRRYEQEAAAQVSDCHIIFGEEGYRRDVAEYLAQSAADRVGFEADTLTYATYQYLDEQLSDVELVSTRGVVEGHR